MTLEVQADLIADLRVLRKGRGLFVGQIAERVGPALRAACDVRDNDVPAEVRRKVAEWLKKLATQLPDDLRVALMGAVGLDPEARLPFYQDRVRWVADRLHRDDRTARRRIDEAIDRIAEIEALAMRTEQPKRRRQVDPRWRTEELRVSLALDRLCPEVIEFRRVAAETDGLDQFNLSVTVSALGNRGATPDDLSVDVFHGGTLVDRHLESTSRVGFALRLPRPLVIGQAHELMLRFRLEPGRNAQPHYVCVPRHRCDLFDLNVRFDPKRLPRAVQRVAGLFQTDITDLVVPGENVDVDAAGEVHAVFRQLTPGMAYGLRWQF